MVKTLDVFDWELVKQPLKCVRALKQWMSITCIVYLMWSEWRTTWSELHDWNTIYDHTSDGLCLTLYMKRSTWSRPQHWNWIMISHCVGWPAAVEKSMKICNSIASMDCDKNVFNFWWTKELLKHIPALKHWIVINYGLCIFCREWRSSWSRKQHWNTGCW